MPIINLVYEAPEKWKPWENTLLYYSFNNDTASTSYDWAGNNNWTWNNNTWTYQTVSWTNKCCQLTATSWKYMTIPTSLNYPTTNFTFSFWVKYTQSTNNSRAIFSKWDGNYSSNAYLYIYQMNWKIGVDIPYVATLFTTSNTYNDGIRHNVVLTKSWSSYTLYIDNIQIWTATNSFSIHWWSNTVWLIWANNARYEVWLDWLLDEFIIENKDWTSDDRTNYYNLTKSNYGY